MPLAKEIFEKASLWSQSPSFDLTTQREIQDLIQSSNEIELTNRFYKDLEFGTGGMRGLMGAGTAYFNIYNVRRATQALATYLKKLHGQNKIKVALSYDSRNNSRLYAQAACEILSAHGIQSLLTSEMRPVPMLSFMVRHFKCQAGICITASHNPAPYNGYKIYWESGGQLTSPHDKNILALYTEFNDYSQFPIYKFSDGIKSGLIREIKEELDSAYLTQLKSLSVFEEGRDLSIVYSPVHGTGIYAVPQALSSFGFKKLTLVKEQSQPDGNFPTVASPNPEEEATLELARKLGVEISADIVLATDPDSDRLAVVVREDSEWKMFTGNQMGALFFEYILSKNKEKNKIPENAFTIITVVTSNLLKDISNHYGLSCEETLTGFKWICDRVEAYESGERKPYKHFICGAEESYGFLTGTFVRDKDAVMSAVLACEMLAYYKSIGKKLSTVLDEIYLRHGVYFEHLETMTLTGKDGEEKIKSIMKNLRLNPPKNIGNFKIQSCKDYLQETGLPKSDVLQFSCKEFLMSIRPSGTEPKIKIYLSLHEPLVYKENLSHIKKELEKKSKHILSSFVQEYI